MTFVHPINIVCWNEKQKTKTPIILIISTIIIVIIIIAIIIIGMLLLLGRLILFTHGISHIMLTGTEVAIDAGGPINLTH